MSEKNTDTDIKNVKLIYIQQTLTGFDLKEKTEWYDKFSFASTGSLIINFKKGASYKKVELFNSYIPILYGKDSYFIFTKPFDEEKAMKILLSEKKENVKWEIERIDQDIKSLEFEKSDLLKIIYKKSD